MSTVTASAPSVPTQQPAGTPTPTAWRYFLQQSPSWNTLAFVDVAPSANGVFNNVADGTYRVAVQGKTATQFIGSASVSDAFTVAAPVSVDLPGAVAVVVS